MEEVSKLPEGADKEQRASSPSPEPTLPARLKAAVLVSLAA